MQLELDLGDKLYKFECIARDMIKSCWTYSQVMIYSTQDPDTYWIGYRNGGYETDHHRLHLIDWETARHLVSTFPEISGHFECVEKRMASEVQDQSITLA